MVPQSKLSPQTEDVNHAAPEDGAEDEEAGTIELATVLGQAGNTPKAPPEKLELGPDPLVHEVFPVLGGNNRFPLKGRCITGPHVDFKFCGCAWTFILLPTFLYFVVASNHLWVQESPWLPIVTAMLFCSTILFLLLTSCTDPGIIPRRELQFVVSGLIDEVAAATATAPLNRANINFTQEMDNDGYRWCPTCKIVRPPRASHCRVCDNCVLRFDHHCPFVNNCIGQRNYVYFNGFLVSVLGLGISVFAGFGIYIGSLSGSLEEGAQAGQGDTVKIFLVVIALPTAVMLMATLGLGLFHLFLAARGTTTKELLTGKKRPSQRRNQDSTLETFTVRGPRLVNPRDKTTYPNECV